MLWRCCHYFYTSWNSSVASYLFIFTLHFRRIHDLTKSMQVGVTLLGVKGRNVRGCYVVVVFVLFFTIFVCSNESKSSRINERNKWKNERNILHSTELYISALECDKFINIVIHHNFCFGTTERTLDSFILQKTLLLLTYSLELPRAWICRTTVPVVFFSVSLLPASSSETRHVIAICCYNAQFYWIIVGKDKKCN